MIIFHIVTLFPETLEVYADSSMLWKAKKDKKIKIIFYNPRDFSKKKHKKVDDKPYGGGPGMVMSVDPILRAVMKIKKGIERKESRRVVTTKQKTKIKTIILSPQGSEFTNTYAQTLAKRYEHIILIAGHYEGIDARVKKILKAEEVSIGNYTLTGGELPSMVIVDAVSRQIKGVLGNDFSLEEKRVNGREVYTRPDVYEHEGKKYRVPKVLLSGNHKDIEEWKSNGGNN